MKKITTKIMQIDSKEFQKCKSGQEFKAKFVSHPGPKPPVSMPKWFKSWAQTEFQSVKDTLAEHGKAIAALGENDKKIFDVLNRNNLH